VKKNTILVIACSLLFLLGSVVYGEVLRFRYVPGEKYRIVTQVKERVFVNGKYSHTADILDKITVSVLEENEGTGLLECHFQTSERSYGRSNTYKLDSDYYSKFLRSERGIYTIDSKYFMPVVRNVPVFPEKDVKEGESWSADGEEVHDLRANFGVDKAFHFPVHVNYRYLGNRTVDGREVAAIKIDYSVFYKVKGTEDYTGNVPRIITGTSSQVYYFDNNMGKPHSYREEFDFIFHLASGDYVEWTGESEGKVIIAEPLKRGEVKREIEKDIEKRGIEDAKVKEDENGVTISLQNINFPPNSALLVPSEKEKLRKIGEILKKYPDRDILITGHTARIGTEESCQILSEERARAVGDFLLSIGAKKLTQMIFRGKGSREPVADNSTEEGRKQNRRVEITILEN